MPKQREGFNFYRSYYDVFKMLTTDKDKVQFIKALLEKQFEGKEPKKLTGQSKFAYVSQQHSINKQVKGWEDKNKCKLSTLTEGGAYGGSDTPTEQVQEEEKEELEEEEERPKKTVFNFRKSLIDLGVEEKVAEDFMKVRKKKKATDSETAFNLLHGQIEKSGKSANECILICIERDWKSFNHSWVSQSSSTKNSDGSPKFQNVIT